MVSIVAEVFVNSTAGALFVGLLVSIVCTVLCRLQDILPACKCLMWSFEEIEHHFSYVREAAAE